MDRPRRFPAATDRHQAIDAPRRIGAVVGDQFHLTSVVGSGPHGTVYEATELRTARSVAIKVLEPGIARPLARPRRASTHPSLVDVQAVDPLDDRLCLRSEMVRGVDLASLLSEGPFAPRVALRLLRNALDGLHALHRGGSVHGGLKPENLMIPGIGIPDEEVSDAVRILDVGLHGVLCATAPDRYRAPEVAHTNLLTERNDLYAMGVILVEMLRGEPYASPVMLDRRLPDEVGFIVWKALQPDPRDRFGSAAEMRNAADVALRAF